MPSSVGSVSDLIDAVNRRQQGDQDILWFRGQRDDRWDVEPSIRRGYTPLDERNFTNRFRSRAAIRYSPAPAYDAHAAWLGLMQHYGLPTRILDWTRSPLVAAYFAVEHRLADMVDSSPGADAVIWVLRPHAMNRIHPDTDVTPSIDAVMCKELLAPAFTDNAAEPNTVMAVMAAETDLRMFVQQGCFTIHSDPTALNRLNRNAEFIEKLTVPAADIAGLAHEVSVCGFREGDIFPDLGHLAQELRHAYPPHGAAATP
ncbi:FRG domain-containing protein [Paractinoplanes toevensis]|nr:FRG domain-containing protein [Actinoplanes toevensis]